jgi:tRNA pseudouridine55 synthase
MDGILLIDKPAGLSSHDVVAAVKRSLGGPKTGHAGTLDPFATGLLIILLGRATKAQSTIMGLPKRYEVLARLGATSTTGDTEGEITETGRLPPHSAIKVGGERAYKKARRGESFEMPERIVTVHSFRQLWRTEGEGEEPPMAAFAIECGSGTYVRSLIADLGDAYCLELRRTAIGPFLVSDAVGLPPRGEPWENPPVIELDEALELARH